MPIIKIVKSEISYFSPNAILSVSSSSFRHSKLLSLWKCFVMILFRNPLSKISSIDNVRNGVNGDFFCSPIELLQIGI